MREYISREAANDTINETAYEYEDDKALTALYHAADRLNDLPAADVVEVVRCADCKYDERCMVQDFVRENRVVPYDKTVFYCADGKRKNGEQE